MASSSACGPNLSSGGFMNLPPTGVCSLSSGRDMECSLTATSFGDHHDADDADDEFNERNISGGGRGKVVGLGLGSPKMLQPPSFDQVLTTLISAPRLFTIYTSRRTLNQGISWTFITSLLPVWTR